LRNYCRKCGKAFTAEYMLNYDGPVPKCDSCGSGIKPDVVLYGESLDDAQITGAVRAISQADMLIIGGTSLVVYPAAGLIDYYKGHKLVLINRDATPRDSIADLVINDSIGKVFSMI
ncbi:MAG: NAD-dependent protein deacylase, partial [Parasporobacterium sp.]|nr:NAD-dependent protein deacylase [Parasporobacterium sp.]